jgi:hypothetical protein
LEAFCKYEQASKGNILKCQVTAAGVAAGSDVTLTPLMMDSKPINQ